MIQVATETFIIALFIIVLSVKEQQQKPFNSHDLQNSYLENMDQGEAKIK